MASVLNILTIFLVLAVVSGIQGQGFGRFGDDDRFDDLYEDDLDDRFDDLFDRFDDLYDEDLDDRFDDLFDRFDELFDDDLFDDLDDVFEFDDDNFFGRGPFGRGPFGFNPRFGLGYHNRGLGGRTYGFGK